MFKVKISTIVSIAKSYGIEPAPPYDYLDLFWAVMRGKKVGELEYLKEEVAGIPESEAWLDSVRDLPLDKKSHNVVIDYSEIMASP